MTARLIEHADALVWLPRQEPGTARAVIYDPPYSTSSPVRGREDGLAGPFGFMHRTMSLCARTLRPGGIIIVFADWRRMPDLEYTASMVGLRPATQVAWIRNRPGTGGLLRACWDPILVAARGVPDAVDWAAIRNVVVTDDVVVADYPSRRRHPYEKPPEVYEHILARVCRRGDVVLDPFAGSGSSRVAADQLGLELVWRGCDIDPEYAEQTGRV